MSAGESDYGIRVTVDAEVLQERTLGSFDSADRNGKVSRTSVREQIHSTSVEAVEASSYHFESKREGIFAAPVLWSFLSIFSSSFLLGLFVYRILYPKLELGLPIWVYYAFLASVFLGSKFMELRRARGFVVLSLAARTLAEAERLYGKEPIIDLPQGRLREVRSSLELMLKPFQEVDSPESGKPPRSYILREKGDGHGIPS